MKKALLTASFMVVRLCHQDYDIMYSGSVAEWLKAHDSKSCGQKCLGGSNPLASARK